MVYQAHYPFRSMQTARGAKRSVLHDRYVEQGAYFRDVSGWEGPDWYAGQGKEPDPGELSWGRPAWFQHWKEEHEATRNGVIVMDMSFMAKYLVEGRDAGRALDWVSANRVNGESGMITYEAVLDPGVSLDAPPSEYDLHLPNEEGTTVSGVVARLSDPGGSPTEIVESVQH